jgi:hypothetical protein
MEGIKKNDCSLPESSNSKFSRRQAGVIPVIPAIFPRGRRHAGGDNGKYIKFVLFKIPSMNLMKGI